MGLRISLPSGILFLSKSTKVLSSKRTIPDSLAFSNTLGVQVITPGSFSPKTTNTKASWSLTF